MILDFCQRGLVQMSLMIAVGLSGYLRVSEMFNLQGGDEKAPSLGITAHHSLLLFPEQHPQRCKVGKSDNSLLLDSSWLKGIEPMLAILARRPPRPPHLDFHVSATSSRIPQNNNSLLWCLTKSNTQECPSTEHGTFGHNKQHSAEGGGHSCNRWSLTKRALDLPIFVTKTQSASKVLLHGHGLSAALGGSEEVVHPCAHFTGIFLRRFLCWTLMRLPHVFVVHLHECQFGSLFG